jgi:hypothetical protein
MISMGMWRTAIKAHCLQLLYKYKSTACTKLSTVITTTSHHMDSTSAMEYGYLLCFFVRLGMKYCCVVALLTYFPSMIAAISSWYDPVGIML